jgi:hypothetical protein
MFSSDNTPILIDAPKSLFLFQHLWIVLSQSDVSRN